LGNAASPDAAKNMTACSIGEIPARHKPGGGYDGQSFSKKSRRAAEIPRFLSFLRIALALSTRQWRKNGVEEPVIRSCENRLLQHY
jgi:hypothetical protein